MASRRLPLVLLVLLAVAAQAAAAPPRPEAYRPAAIEGPLDPAKEPQNVAVPYRGTYPGWLWSDVAREAIEPTIGIDKQGAAFFPAATFEEPANGVGGHGYLMRSTDG